MATTTLTSRETARWLGEREGFLILTHRRPDGDTLGSAAGLCRGLREAGKTAYVHVNPETTERYLEYVAPYIAPEDYRYAVVVAVDMASEGMLAVNAGEFAGKIDLCIDHHPSNTRYAQNLCLEADRAACGEIIYDILMELSGEISADTALPLYVALTTDTGCFAYANTTADTLTVAGALLRAGADNRRVNKKLFRTKTRKRIALDGEIYSGLRLFRGGEVAVSTITLSLLEKTGATEDDLDDVAAIPGQVEGVSVGITVRELEPGRTKISVRTTPAVSANAICQKLGGGGHNMAAGCNVELSPEEALEAILQAVDEVCG